MRALVKLALTVNATITRTANANVVLAFIHQHFQKYDIIGWFVVLDFAFEATVTAVPVVMFAAQLVGTLRPPRTFVAE